MAASLRLSDRISTSSSVRAARFADIENARLAGIIGPVTQRQPDPAPGAPPERGFIAAVLAPGIDEEEELGELRELARTAGVEPVGEVVQHRAKPDRRTYVGKGKLEE